MFMSLHQIAAQRHNINIANRSFENTEKLKYLGMAPTDTIHEDIKIRLNSGDACFCSVQTRLPFCLPSVIINIKVICTRPLFYLLFCMDIKLGLSY
jgi:hypothetical protein